MGKKTRQARAPKPARQKTIDSDEDEGGGGEIPYAENSYAVKVLPFSGLMPYRAALSRTTRFKDSETNIRE